MEPMKEWERLWSLIAVLFFVICIWAGLWVDGTNERMAQLGYMPLRLQGDNKIYWLPIPMEKKSSELDGMLRKQ